MNIKAVDADFKTFLAQPGITAEETARFIAYRYLPVVKCLASAILKKQGYPGPAAAQRAEDTAQEVLMNQTGQVLRNDFKFDNRSLYSSYLYTIIYRAFNPRKNTEGRELSLDGVSGESTPDGAEERRTVPEPVSRDDPLRDTLRMLVLERFDRCSACLSPAERQFVSRVLSGEKNIKEAGCELGYANPQYAWKLIQAKLKAHGERERLEPLYRAYLGVRDRMRE